MQQIPPIPAEVPSAPSESEGATVRRAVLGHLRRFWILYAAVVLLLGAAVLPPLINVGRFQRRIATSIGGSLGRPVHLDQVSLSLLPLPGFEIQNLVVDEDPAFGAEPIIRANTVRATLRLSSLWRRQVEFSTISFTDPSLNLVHAANGRWNIEGVLLQASRIEAAPTDQRRAGRAPRFPYIEATGARINFKQGLEKMPFSLVDSEFALWSANPNQWRIRLRARPTRTDSNVFDTGAVDLEGTLGRGDSLAHMPINLEWQWRDAPLGEASRVLFGHDAGWRGNMGISANIRGTLGESAVTARLRLLGARRADFVPQQPLSADAQCFATATAIFHAYEDLRCAWAPEGNSTTETPLVALTGVIPDILQPEKAIVQVGTSGVSAATVLSWLRVLSPGISDRIAVSGKLAGSLSYDGADGQGWVGQLAIREAGIKASPAVGSSLVNSDLILRLVPDGQDGQPAGLVLNPVSVALGGRDPAVLEGRFDTRGYNLRLSGMATQDHLRELSTAIAPLGIGLVQTPEPAAELDGPNNAASRSAAPAARVDFTSTAGWGDQHQWHEAAVRQPQNLPRRQRRR